MTKTYALKRLLEHGAMDIASIAACTRWKPFEVKNAVRSCLHHKLIKRRRASGNASPCAKFEYEAVINQGA